MFRASPWISYDPSQRQTDPDLIQTYGPEPGQINNLQTTTTTPHEHPSPPPDMDAPEISILREEEEETPPPESGLAYSKFRLNMRLPTWGQVSTVSGSAIGPPVGPPPIIHRGLSIPDSDDEDEEDQLIDDDELAIVTETGRGPATSSPASLAAAGSPSSTPSPRKRGGSTRARPRRGGASGRRGRPGREPPDAAAMMSTFEVTKTEQAGSSSAQIIPPVPIPVGTPELVAGPSNADWTTASPPKPPRKKPGPKKGTTLGPRGPRKSGGKTGQGTPGTSTPILDDALAIDSSAFLLPAPPSIPSTPGPDQPSLPLSHLPPILPPDFTIDPTIPVPTYPLPTRGFPVQAAPKVPSGYAPTNPIDTKRGPVRKWTIMRREIKGIAGGRWLARTWVAPQSVPPQAQAQAAAHEQIKAHAQADVRPPSPPPAHADADADAGMDTASAQVVPSPLRVLPALDVEPGPELEPGAEMDVDMEAEAEAGPSQVSIPGSRASSVKPDAAPTQAHSDLEQLDVEREPAQWLTTVRDAEGEFSSRGPGSPRTSVSPSSSPLDAAAEQQDAPP